MQVCHAHIPMYYIRATYRMPVASLAFGRLCFVCSLRVGRLLGVDDQLWK